MVQKENLKQGLGLLKQPVLPLVSMVEFFLLTGDFATVAEIVEQLPDPIETDYARYDQPAELLKPYLEQLETLLAIQQGAEPPWPVITENGEEVDLTTAMTALVDQKILTMELEAINSALCEPCGCTLCCIGPDQSMEQAFFEIPLRESEADLFEVEKIETVAAQQCNAMDEPPLQVEGKDFFARTSSALVHWQKGWSLILPKMSSCPNLESQTGRCTVYTDRPEVCRRPQIFPYILEPVTGEDGEIIAQRLRRTLLAVIDCPYVEVLQEEIAAYAAACELDLVIKRNKG